VLGQEIFNAPDLGEYDRIEVLRGSDALFGGNGNPGATISLIRKRPLHLGQLKLTGFAGSWNDYRVEADLTGPLNTDGSLRGRVDAAYTRNDYFFDTAKLDKRKVFGVLEYDVTSRTIVRVGGSFESVGALPDVSGLPRFPDGGDPHLPRSTAYTFNWADYDKNTQEIYVQLEQSLGNLFRLQVNATQLRSSAEFAHADILSTIDPDTHLLEYPEMATVSTRPNTQHQFAMDTTLTGHFYWFGRRQRVALGADYTRLTSLVSLKDSYILNPLQADAYRFNPDSFPDPRVSGDYIFQRTDSPFTSNQRGFYASFETGLLRRLTLSAGARLGASSATAGLRYSTDTQSVFGAFDSRNTWKLTPYAGLMYNFGQHYSAYVSYADIAETNGTARSVSGKLLPAMDGDTLEAGIKAVWREGALTAALAIYRIEQRGLEEFDPNTPPDKFSPVCCYAATGLIKSRGLDAEVLGRPVDGWLLGMSYDYNIHGVIDPATATPRTLFKLWTRVDLPGRLRGWMIGGDLSAQSSNYESSGACCTQGADVKVLQGPYAIVGLRGGYRINTHWSATVGVSNVFDRVYIQTVASSFGGNWYGEPRAVQVRVDATY
jgi:TonB-dependent siderophore receptor